MKIPENETAHERRIRLAGYATLSAESVKKEAARRNSFYYLLAFSPSVAQVRICREYEKFLRCMYLYIKKYKCGDITDVKFTNEGRYMHLEDVHNSYVKALTKKRDLTVSTMIGAVASCVVAYHYNVVVVYIIVPRHRREEKNNTIKEFTVMSGADTITVGVGVGHKVEADMLNEEYDAFCISIDRIKLQKNEVLTEV